jgi:hypothetical protein
VTADQAVAYCHYLVMILALKSLDKAAENDALNSDTYRCAPSLRSPLVQLPASITTVVDFEPW